MKTITEAEVRYHGRIVGNLALYKGRCCAFQYTREWLHEGFSISPFSLPLKENLYLSTQDPFNGLWGVFDDCLPDGWGRLLTDRLLAANGIQPSSVNVVTRLSLLSSLGMGALEFVPCQAEENDRTSAIDFDKMKENADALLKDKEIPLEDMDTLYNIGGSSGGARPKGYIRHNGAEWIVKFPSSIDPRNIGTEEFMYNEAAQLCGIIVPETMLIPSRTCGGYFAAKRFDREGTERIHMVTIGGLLECSHRYPVLDYDHIFRCLLELSRSNEDTERLYRQMCFNVYAHNRDDHSKNFSFLYTEDSGWRLSPAYDLTYSSSLNGEHATMVNHNGKDPSLEDLVAVGKRFGIQERRGTTIAKEIQEITRERLKDYLA